MFDPSLLAALLIGVLIWGLLRYRNVQFPRAEVLAAVVVVVAFALLPRQPQGTTADVPLVPPKPTRSARAATAMAVAAPLEVPAVAATPTRVPPTPTVASQATEIVRPYEVPEGGTLGDTRRQWEVTYGKPIGELSHRQYEYRVPTRAWIGFTGGDRIALIVLWSERPPELPVRQPDERDWTLEAAQKLVANWIPADSKLEDAGPGFLGGHEERYFSAKLASILTTDDYRSQGAVGPPGTFAVLYQRNERGTVPVVNLGLR